MAEKRVLHLVEYLYQGGVERLLEQIARHTPAEQAALFFYAYQAPRLEGIGLELSRLGRPLTLYDKPKGYDFLLLGKLIAYVRENRVTTVHTHDFGPMEYAVALKLRFPKLQLVHTHHSLHYFLRFPKYVRFFGIAALFYDRILCVSDHVRDELAKRCPLARNRLVTIYNGIDVAAFRDEAVPVARNRLRLVSVCRISPEKNLAQLVETCAELNRAGIDFELHHAGSGPPEEEQKLRALVHKHQLENQVHWHGFRADVREILRLGDVFVSTSTTEGHPVAVLEAMASGKLCVCSDIPPHRLLSAEGIVFFKLADGSLYGRLVDIAERPEFYRAYRERAEQEVGARFSLRRMLDEYEQVYT